MKSFLLVIGFLSLCLGTGIQAFENFDNLPMDDDFPVVEEREFENPCIHPPEGSAVEPRFHNYKRCRRNAGECNQSQAVRGAFDWFEDPSGIYCSMDAPWDSEKFGGICCTAS